MITYRSGHVTAAVMWPDPYDENCLSASIVYAIGQYFSICYNNQQIPNIHEDQFLFSQVYSAHYIPAMMCVDRLHILSTTPVCLPGLFVTWSCHLPAV